MLCSLTRSLLDLYVKGKLAPAQARRVKAHISKCEKCAAEARAWHDLFYGLSALPAEAEPAGLKEALRAAVAAASETKRESAKGDVVMRSADPTPSLSFAFGFAVLFVSIFSAPSIPSFHAPASASAASDKGPAAQVVSSSPISGVKP